MDLLNKYELSFFDNQKWYNNYDKIVAGNLNEVFTDYTHTDCLILREVFNINAVPTVDKTKQDEDFEIHYDYIKRSITENTDSFTFIKNYDYDMSQDVAKALEYIDIELDKNRHKDAFISDTSHIKSTRTTKNLDADEFPTFTKIVKDLGVTEAKVRFMVQPPGHLVPTHIDNLNHKTNHKRFGVACNDWAYGQFWHFGKEVWANWKTGDCIQWHNLTPHGTGNVGHSDRYTLQITGVV